MASHQWYSRSRSYDLSCLLSANLHFWLIALSYDPKPGTRKSGEQSTEYDTSGGQGSVRTAFLRATVHLAHFASMIEACLGRLKPRVKHVWGVLQDDLDEYQEPSGPTG